MAEDFHRQIRFDEISKQAADIRKQIDGGMYYGIPIVDYPNQDDVYLVISYSLRHMKDLAVKVEVGG